MDEKHLSTYSVIDREYIDYALSVEGVAVPFPTSVIDSFIDISADLGKATSEFWANAIANRIMRDFIRFAGSSRDRNSWENRVERVVRVVDFEVLWQVRRLGALPIPRR